MRLANTTRLQPQMMTMMLIKTRSCLICELTADGSVEEAEGECKSISRALTPAV